MTELKLLIYWIIITIILRFIAHIDHKINAPNIKFQYYESFLSLLFQFIFIFGMLLITLYALAQFTNYFFIGEFIQI